MEMIDYIVNDRIGYITLNRPEKRNALSAEVVTLLKKFFAVAENDDSVKVIVLRANGNVFCSGADLAMLQQLQSFSYEDNVADSRHLSGLFLQIYQLKKVVIAQVQGHALAGGCGLASVCDFVYAVPQARFGYTEVKIGFIPAIVSVFLLRKIGEQKAKQLLLTGDLISSDHAMAIGLIDHVVAPELLETSVFTFAQGLITHNSASSMELTKKMIAGIPSLTLEDALEYAVQMNATARNSEDCKKGISAFLGKRDLTW